MVERMPLPRLMTRYMTTRCRPVTLLLMFLGLWLISFLIYFSHSTNVTSAIRDMSAASVYQMQAGTVGGANVVTGGMVPRFNSQDLAKEQQDPLGPSSLSADEAFQAEAREFERRRKVYEDQCKSGISGPVSEVFYYSPAKLAVCHVPKVGCTFWKRIFHFLYNDTDGKTIHSPFEIDRFYVHFGGKKKSKVTGYNAMKDTLDTYNKVLFTRDPWARLWSAYVDKFVLPDSWLDHGRSIVSRRKDKKRHTMCSNNIEFPEFLDYVLYSSRDGHWRPVHKVCSPCTFKPQYLGKMESFSKDSTHILRKAGLEHLVQGHDHAHYAEDEVSILTKYHFRLYETRSGLRKCLSHSGVAERLWKAFVFNGYIRDNVTFPAQMFAQVLDGMTSTRQAGEKATELLLNYHRTSKKTSHQMRDYRRRVMVQQYRQAPLRLLNKLVDTFAGDFTLFEYEARPNDIFEGLS